ncbi:MAG: hypothetical protein PHT07_01800 [Paludibacter sp.]|nr:hypothetical protein [Paludibacter sp.]
MKTRIQRSFFHIDTLAPGKQVDHSSVRVVDQSEQVGRKEGPKYAGNLELYCNFNEKVLFCMEF